MRRLRILAVAVVSALMSPTAASAYSFGDWASDNGYSPGDVMPETVRAWRSSIDSIDGIGEFDWATTPTITLDLQHNQISSIEAGDFNGLTTLRHLNLRHNQISSIEAGDFDGLTNLAGLYLPSNSLSSIESGVFDGLATLTRLHLDGNQISIIESGAFNGLTNVWELNLHSNQISNIESGAFSGLTNLAELRLHSNQISNIESGAFNGLTNVWELNLHSNQLSTIESGDFDGLTNLAELNLRYNRISSIESGTFSGLTNLMTLDLHQNNLTELNLDAADFTSLTTFDASSDANIPSVTLRSTVVNQTSLARLLDGGWACAWGICTGIGELPGITEMDLSGIDFVNITDLAPLYVMDDLTDLWLANTQNMDAVGLDVLLDNLATIEGADIEGILYMTQADFDAFNTAGGGLLAAWDAEPGHHVEFVDPADLNGDGFVDGLDLGTLLGNFEQSGVPASGGELNGTDPVDGLDLGILLGAWNSPLLPPASSVPEPCALMLTVLAAIGIFARRGRCFA